MRTRKRGPTPRADTIILIPTRGFSGIDKPSQPFYNPEADEALLKGLKQELTEQCRLLTTWEGQSGATSNSDQNISKIRRDTYEYSTGSSVENLDVVEIDCHINDTVMALEAVRLLVQLLGLPLDPLS